MRVTDCLLLFVISFHAVVGKQLRGLGVSVFFAIIALLLSITRKSNFLSTLLVSPAAAKEPES